MTERILKREPVIVNNPNDAISSLGQSLINNDLPYVPKGWGYERWICNTDKYCSKILFIAKDRKLSWHYHKIKEEHFYILEGSGIVYLNTHDSIEESVDVYIAPGDVVHIPPGIRHRIYAYEDLKIIETSTHHEDSDSIRLIKGD